MEIHDNLPPVHTQQPVSPARETQKAPSQPAGTTGPADRVAISKQARELQAAHEAVARMPDVDLEKVNRVKESLKAGTYSVNAGQAATRMLSESLLASR